MTRAGSDYKSILPLAPLNTKKDQPVPPRTVTGPCLDRSSPEGLRSTHLQCFAGKEKADNRFAEPLLPAYPPAGAVQSPAGDLPATIRKL